VIRLKTVTIPVLNESNAVIATPLRISFHIVGQIQIQAWSLRRSEYTVTRQVAPLNCALGDEVGYRKLPCLCCWSPPKCSKEIPAF